MFRKHALLSLGICLLTACDSNLDSFESKTSSDVNRDISLANPLSTIAGNPLVSNLLVYQNNDFIFDIQSVPRSTRFQPDDLISLEVVTDDHVEVYSVQFFIEFFNPSTEKLGRKEVASTFVSRILNSFSVYRFTAVVESNLGESEKSTSWIINEASYVLQVPDVNAPSDVIGGEQ